MKRQYDIIVCGGGVAGVAAAVTAANSGHSVLIMEKSNILGGLATLGLVNLFVPMCNGRGKQIIFGLCEKWVRLSAEYGYDTIPKDWKYGEPKEPTEIRYIQRFSPNIFALQLTEEIGPWKNYSLSNSKEIINDNKRTDSNTVIFNECTAGWHSSYALILTKCG